MCIRDRYYMDSMRAKSKFKHKTISGVLNGALSEFAQRGGNLPSQGKAHKMENFKHITDISCVEQSSDHPVGYILCWHLAYLVRIQNKLVTAKDLRKIYLDIKQSEFDSTKELTRIQGFFARIINQEVAVETGLFYSSEGTLEDGSSHMRVGLCFSSQSQVYMLLWLHISSYFHIVIIMFIVSSKYVCYCLFESITSLCAGF